jgi:organic radical activating enzyme
MKLTYSDPDKENWFLVAWTLSNKCNYRCSYCPSSLHDGSTGQPRWETVERFVKEFPIKDKKICYRISGGEPTYWKHFIDLAKLIKDRGHHFTFLTNGSQSVDYYKEISRYSDGIMLSFHPGYSDADHFVDIANSVECPIVVNLMLDRARFSDLVTVAKSLFENTKNLAVWPKVILDKTSSEHITNIPMDYSLEQKALIKNWPYFRSIDDSKIHRGNLLFNDAPITGNDIILKNLNNYNGWNCWAGLHMISIDMWGNIYRSECRQGGPLGNLERYKLPTSTITCGANQCSCLSDIYLRKESNDIN